MTFLYVLCGATCFVSVVNLVAVLFLSNSLYRIFAASRLPPPSPTVERRERGLVDPSATVTYDPRFRS